MKQLRVYVDTSVIGGCLDEEFAEESLALLDAARAGRFLLLISDLLVEKLLQAPEEVSRRLTLLSDDSVERVFSTPETERLRNRYMRAGVVGPASIRDAHHVAIATVARADVIVSWNFKHLVHFEKIRAFNAVNLVEGYALTTIHSPREVL